MRIMLTGASGILGGSLHSEWLNAGHEISLLVRRKSLKKISQKTGRDTKIIVIENGGSLDRFLQYHFPNVIVHTATAYGRNNETPLEIMDSNIRLGVELMQAVMFVSKRGKHEPVTFINTGTSLPPDLNLYALSKAQFSKWGEFLSNAYPDRLQFIDIKLQQLYGFSDDQNNFTSQVISKCYNNAPSIPLTLGEQYRDFIYLTDAVKAIDIILKSRSQFASCDSIDVGSGCAIKIKTFVETVKQLSKASTVLQFGALPYRTNEPIFSQANTHRLKELGWQNQHSLAEGIALTLNQLERLKNAKKEMANI